MTIETTLPDKTKHTIPESPLGKIDLRSIVAFVKDTPITCILTSAVVSLVSQNVFVGLAAGGIHAIVGVAANRDNILKSLMSDITWMKHPKSCRSAFQYKLIQLFSAYKSNIDSFQPCLPRMPIPPLQQTCDKYLQSIRPLLSEDEYITTKATVEKFLGNEGKILQQHLQEYASTKDNWLEDIWLSYAYLKRREPLPFSTNIYALGSTKKRVFEKDVNPQLIRACYLIKGSLNFKNMIDRGTLPPEKYYGIPASMDQYHSLFSTTRIPQVGEDQLETHADSQHLIIVKHNHFIKFDCYHDNRPLTLGEIWLQLQQLDQMLDEQKSEGKTVSLFTAQDRDQWATDRLTLLSSEKNKETIKCIETAIALISLETEEKDATEDFVSQVFLNPKNRWYDKSLQAIIAPSGKIGFNVEHSGADGTIISAMINHVFSREEKNYSLPDNTVLLPTPKGTSDHTDLTPPRILEWDETSKIFEKIPDLRRDFEEKAIDYDIKIFYFDNYGKGAIKKMRLSPDAYIQMAIQLAYYKLTKKLALTYETASTRVFLNGRTETIRTVSEDSKQFVLAMADPNSSKEKRLSALRDAVKSHVQYVKDASLGEGIDRHLLGLKAQANKYDISSPFFSDKSYNLEWKLLTSQTPCPTSLGGGFTPENNGYGISYHVFEDRIFFNISSKKSCQKTNSTDFTNILKESLMEMQGDFIVKTL